MTMGSAASVDRDPSSFLDDKSLSKQSNKHLSLI